VQNDFGLGLPFFFNLHKREVYQFGKYYQVQ